MARALQPRPLLSGASVVVTRAPGTTASIARSIRAAGGRVVLLPGLSLRALAPDDAVRAAIRDAAGFDGWIFTSPSAVRFGVAVVRAVKKRRRQRVFAIGEGTARALARHGIAAIIPPDRADSEGLLALPELKSIRGRRMALVGAPGGRDVIAPTLRRRGARVEAIHVYRREPPRLTERHFAALDAAPDPVIMLVSSGEALGNLVAAVSARRLARLRTQALVVSSARLVAVARGDAFAEIVMARSAAPGDLLAAASAALARHRL